MSESLLGSLRNAPSSCLNGSSCLHCRRACSGRFFGIGFLRFKQFVRGAFGAAGEVGETAFPLFDFIQRPEPDGATTLGRDEQHLQGEHGRRNGQPGDYTFFKTPIGRRPQLLPRTPERP